MHFILFSSLVYIDRSEGRKFFWDTYIHCYACMECRRSQFFIRYYARVFWMFEYLARRRDRERKSERRMVSQTSEWASVRWFEDCVKQGKNESVYADQTDFSFGYLTFYEYANTRRSEAISFIEYVRVQHWPHSSFRLLSVLLSFLTDVPINKYMLIWQMVNVICSPLSLSLVSIRLTREKQKHNLSFLITIKNFVILWYSIHLCKIKMLSIFRGISARIAPSASILNKLCSNQSQFHTNAALFEKEKKFLSYNDKIYPPQTEDETPRPAVSLCFENCFNKTHKLIFGSYFSCGSVCLPSERKPQVQSG